MESFDSPAETSASGDLWAPAPSPAPEPSDEELSSDPEPAEEAAQSAESDYVETEAAPEAPEAPEAPDSAGEEGAPPQPPTSWPPASTGPLPPPAGQYPAGPAPGSTVPGWGAPSGPAGTGAPAGSPGIPWPPPGGALPPPNAPGEAYRPASYPPPGPGALPAGGPPPVPGAQPFGAVGPRTTDSRAVIGLVCAVLSFMICPVILAVVGLILAQMSDREIEASGGRLEGQTLNKATRWVAWINIALTVLAVLALILWVFLYATGSVVQSDTQF